jgi:hypothetical protein
VEWKPRGKLCSAAQVVWMAGLCVAWKRGEVFELMRSGGGGGGEGPEGRNEEWLRAAGAAGYTGDSDRRGPAVGGAPSGWRADPAEGWDHRAVRRCCPRGLSS